MLYSADRFKKSPIYADEIRVSPYPSSRGLTIKMADNAGQSVVKFQDSDGNDVVTIDSNGNVSCTMANISAQPMLRTDELVLNDKTTPVEPVPDSLTTEIGVANAELVFTAVENGASGLSVQYIDPTAFNELLSVAIVGNVIQFTLATDGAGLITSIADDLKALILATPAVAALITAEDAAGNDGSGTVTAMAATPLAGNTDGTVGEDGQILRDSTGIYISDGASTAVSYNWKKITYDV